MAKLKHRTSTLLIALVVLGSANVALGQDLCFLERRASADCGDGNCGYGGLYDGPWIVGSCSTDYCYESECNCSACGGDYTYYWCDIAHAQRCGAQCA